MKRLLIILIFLTVTTLANAGEDTSSCRRWIALGGAAGYGVFSDQGMGPVLFQGAEIGPSLGYLSHHSTWRWGITLPLGAGAYGPETAFSLMPQTEVQGMMKVWTKGHASVWAGASLTEAFDFRYVPALDNNATQSSNFLLLALDARAEYSIGPCTLHAGAGFAPASLVFRPGFSYIANYDNTMDNPIADHFSFHHTYLAAANALRTHLGATLLLANGNQIDLSYHWHHLTSRTSTPCPHRFDRASHTLRLTLYFAL